MYIDPHVHCRDEKQEHKETIAHALKVAERAGFTAIFDMPNADPPITTEERVQDRIAIAEHAESPVFYGLYVGATPDTDQVKRIIDVTRKYPQVVGIKQFCTHSVGDCKVIGQENQRRVWQTLAEEGYTGVMALHCEKHELIRTDLWNTDIPEKHCHTRPPEAEIESITEKLQPAREAGYKGIITIEHISTAEGVRIVNQEKTLNVYCGACPHHLLLNSTAMLRRDGTKWKMNPPLRPPGMQQDLYQMLTNGRISWIETDHAPHTEEEKLGPPYMSGIPGLHTYPRFIELLRWEGMKEARIRELTFDNIVRAYGLNL